MIGKLTLHTLLAAVLVAALAFGWQAFAFGGGSDATLASFTTVVEHDLGLDGDD